MQQRGRGLSVKKKTKDNKAKTSTIFRPLSTWRKTLLAVIALVVLFGGVALLEYGRWEKVQADPATTLSTGKITVQGKASETTIEVSISPKEGEKISEMQINNLSDGDGAFDFGPPTTNSDGTVVFTKTVKRKDLIFAGSPALPVKLSYSITDSAGGIRSVIFPVADSNGESLNAEDISEINLQKALYIGEKKSSTDMGDPTLETATTTLDDATGATEECPGSIASDPVKFVICEMGVSAGKWLQNVFGGAVSSVLESMAKWSASKGDVLSSWVDNGWKAARSLVDIVAVIALIIIAFSNILSIGLNTYAVKKIMPNLIGAIIIANLSLFAIRGVMMFSQALATALSDSAGEAVGEALGGFVDLIVSIIIGVISAGDGTVGAAGTAVAGVGLAFGSIIVSILVLIALICIVLLLLVLSFLFLIQPGVVGVLSIAAPIAIILGALPFGQTIFKKWLTLLLNWLFLIPATYLMFSFIFIFKTNPSDGTLASLAFLTVSTILLVLAVRLPFTMGGDVAKAWGKAGNFVRDFAGTRMALGAQRATDAKSTLEQKIASGGKLGRMDNIRYALAGGGKWGIRGKGLAHLVRSASPTEYVKGLKQRAEYERGELEGGALTASWARRAGAGWAVTAKDELESGRRKASRLSTAALQQKFEDMSKDEAMLAGIVEASHGSDNKFIRRLGSGVSRPGRNAAEAAENLAVYEEFMKRASSTGPYGLLANPQSVRKLQENGLLTELPPVVLAQAMSSANATDGGPLVDEQQIDDEIKNIADSNERQRKQEEFDAAKRSRDRLNEVYTSQRRGTSAAEEGTSREPRIISNPDFIPAIIYPSEVIGRMQRAAEEASGSEATSDAISSSGTPKAVEIVSSVDLATVDKGVIQAIESAANSVEQAMEEDGADSETVARVREAMSAAQIGTESIAKVMENEGVKGVVGQEVALKPKTERALQRFVDTSQRGWSVIRSSAEDYERKQIGEQTPYIDKIVEDVREGKTTVRELGLQRERLQLQLDSLRSSEATSPESRAEIVASIKRLAPNPSLDTNTPNETLLRIGRTISSSLEHMQDPAVVRVLESGGSKEKVKETIVRQLANNSIRNTAVDQIGSMVQESAANVAAQQKIKDVSRQVSHFAQASGHAETWQQLRPVEQARIATSVASRAVSAKAIDNQTLDKSINEHIAFTIKHRVAPGATIPSDTGELGAGSVARLGEPTTPVARRTGDNLGSVIASSRDSGVTRRGVMEGASGASNVIMGVPVAEGAAVPTGEQPTQQPVKDRGPRQLSTLQPTVQRDVYTPVAKPTQRVGPAKPQGNTPSSSEQATESTSAQQPGLASPNIAPALDLDRVFPTEEMSEAQQPSGETERGKETEEDGSGPVVPPAREDSGPESNNRETPPS